MKLLKALFIAESLLILTGCVVFLQREQTANLKEGSDAAEVKKAIGSASVTSAHAFTANGKTYLAEHYSLQTGSRSEMTWSCTTYCFPIWYQVPIAVPYVLVYEENKRLYAWGPVEELSRSPNDQISGIMPSLKAAHAASHGAKKKEANTESQQEAKP
jgi:hypothetical protein